MSKYPALNEIRSASAEARAESQFLDEAAARIERGLQVKASAASAFNAERSRDHQGADKIIGARMVANGPQPRTAARDSVVVKAVETVAIIVDRHGERHVERSEVTALFDRAACAVFRLYADGEVAWSGVMAALAFAHAGDRVLGPARVRTSSFDRERGLVSADALSEAEKDAQAKRRWDVAALTLILPERRILDGVMRHDESAVEAARAAFPRVKDRKKLSGFGDMALIRATQALAAAYGFETKKDNARALAGL